MDTELKLLNWRDGQTKAERLCANILSLEGFSSVDPQCPLGGPDGAKDILCEKNGWTYIGAVYFPTEQKQFKDIKDKFQADLAGVSINDADGIAFLTNQKVSPSERDDLVACAETKNHKALIYHRERLRGILDSPIGFGHRLEYLGIEMSKEDQLSFFSSWRGLFEDLLQKQSDHIISEICKRIASSGAGADQFTGMMMPQYIATQNTASYFSGRLPPSDKKALVLPLSAQTTDQLNIELLCMLHRAICFEQVRTDQIGKLRTVKVWIGEAGSTPETARYIPPPPENLPALVDTLLSSWRNQYGALKDSGDKKVMLDAIVRFHHAFSSIHPFIDGNGRISRFLLMQQANELLKCERHIILEDRAPYFDALDRAHKGDMEPLTRVITQALFGEEKL